MCSKCTKWTKIADGRQISPYRIALHLKSWLGLRPYMAAGLFKRNSWCARIWRWIHHLLINVAFLMKLLQTQHNGYIQSKGALHALSRERWDGRITLHFVSDPTVLNLLCNFLALILHLKTLSFPSSLFTPPWKLATRWCSFPKMVLKYVDSCILSQCTSVCFRCPPFLDFSM